MSTTVGSIHPTAENIVRARERVNDSIGFALLFGFLTLVCGAKMFTTENEIDILLWGAGAIVTVVLAFVAVFSLTLRADVMRRLERGEVVPIISS